MPRKAIQKEEYEQIKILCGTKLSQREIGKLINRDDGTISRVNRSQSYDDYMERRRKESKVQRGKKNKDQEPEIIQNNIVEGETSNDLFNLIADIGRLHTQLLREQNEKITLLTGYIRDCARLLNEMNEEWKK